MGGVEAAAEAGGWQERVDPLLFFGGGRQESRPDGSYFYDASERSDPAHVCLQLTLSGTGFYENRQGRVYLPAGCAFLDIIPGDFSYGYAPISDGPYELVYVTAIGREAQAWCHRLTERFGHVLHLGVDSPVAAMMLSLAHRYEHGLYQVTESDGSAHDPCMTADQADGAFKRCVQRMGDADRSLDPQDGAAAVEGGGGGGGDRYLMSGEIYQLFMAVFSQMSQRKLASDKRIHQAIGIMRQRLSDPSLNVRTLADELQCSREYFCRQFRQVVGMPPLDYLTHQRLKRAAWQLRQSDAKLEGIAHDCGFRTASYFCRVFRKQLGLTPAQFREHPTAAIW